MLITVVIRRVWSIFRRQDAATFTWAATPKSLTFITIDTDEEVPTQVPIPTTISFPTFTPGSRCFQTYYHLSPEGPDVLISQTLSQGLRSACLAPEASVPSGVDIAGFTFSPGICPSSFLAVRQGLVGTSRSTTVAACCPLTMTLSNYRCVYTTRTLTLVSNNTTSTVTNGKYQIQAHPFLVAWQSSDEDFLRRVSPTTSVLSSSVQPNISSLTLPTNTSTVPSSTPTGLSTGAEAGIGVGVTAIVIIVAALGYVIWRRRKRLQVQDPVEEEQGKAELDGEGVHRELDSSYYIAETDGSYKPPEVANTERAELETDWAGWEAPVVVETKLPRLPILAPEKDRTRNHSDLQALAMGTRAGDTTETQSSTVDATGITDR